jgi:hypothetical protein
MVTKTRIAAENEIATPAVLKSPKRQEQSSRRDHQREVTRITALGYRVGPGWFGWSETNPPDPQQVEACRQFLSLCTRTKTGRVHSYWLKHQIERAVNTYVSNGACLQACSDLGIAAPRAAKATRPTPYGWVAVSLPSVRSVVKSLAPNVR